MRRTVRSRSAETLSPFPKMGVDRVNFERIFARQQWFEIEDLFLDADRRRSVGFANTVYAVICGDLHQGIGTRAADDHRLNIADFVRPFLRLGEQVITANQGSSRDCSDETASGQA